MGRAQDVLVLGGYGAFGARLCTLLSRTVGITIHIAGRSLGAASAAAHRLRERGARAAEVNRDAIDDVVAYVRANGITVVVDAVGPFHGRTYELALAIAGEGAHAIDIADDRSYVAGIRRLDAEARSRDALIVTGASTVPALSAAVVVHLMKELESLDAVEIGISPGQKSARGLSTVRSVLSYCGKPIPAVRNGRPTTVRGWGDLSRHQYPTPVGGRWLSNVDLPDVALLPEQYPGIETVTVKAGLELSVLHLGLSMLSTLVARGAFASLLPASAALKTVADWLYPFGSSSGAMHVTAHGTRGGTKVATHWSIVAERNDGPFIPVAAASVLTKRLLRCSGYAPIAARGAMPCVGLLTLDELMMELKGLAIRTVQHDG